MKIGVYLLSIHHTFLSDFIQILDPSSNQITLFVSAKMKKLLLTLNPSVESQVSFFVYDGHNLNKYNREVSKKTKNLDYLVVSPNGGRKGTFSHLFLKPKCRYAFIDILFGDAYLNIYHLFNWDFVSNFITKSIYKKQMKNADGILFSSRSIIEMMKSHLYKKMLFLPFNFYHGENHLKKIEHQGINFTVTGGIEPLRKNYTVFFEAVELLIKYNIPNLSNIQFIFLGAVKNKETDFADRVINQAKEINKKAEFELIKIFDETFIPENIYREHIAITDFTLNIINMNYYKYGKFCSGMAESISYAIPGIYPKDYEILPELETSSLKYKSGEDLFRIFKKCINDEEHVTHLTREAQENAQQFTIEKYRMSFFNFINI